MNKVQENIPALADMKSYPKELFFAGNLELLKKTKISIIGSRRPSKYSKELTHKLSSTLNKYDICTVSGGAMGIDAVAHLGSGSSNTISVLPCGINIKYPAVNKNLLADIQDKGLLLSQFKEDFRATPWSFVVRNELVVALGDVLVVAEAQLDSGSMRSIEFALKMDKKIFVFPQRLGDSSATNELLKQSKAKAIYDIEEFIFSLFPHAKFPHAKDNEFLKYCSLNPSYEEALKKYPNKVFESELGGEIEIKNAKVYLV